jgi:carbamoylphosphate synthase large subunit
VVQQTFPYGSLYPLEALEAAIKVSEPSIIVPCDDRGVMHLHELYDRACNQGAPGVPLASLIERSLGPSESYPIVSCRWELLKVAREEGIRIPDTQLLNSVEDLEPWQDGHNLPWVLKGNGTFGGRGVRIAYSLDQAANYFSEITRLFTASRAIKRAIVNRDPFWLRPWWKKQKPAVIVQSHIQGRPANCAVVCWKGNVQAGIAVEVICSDGLTGPATIVRVVESPAMITAAELIARRLELSGFFGLDFVIEEGSRTAYLIEMNPRCTPLSHLQLGKGRDLMEAFSAELSSRPLRENPPVTLNDTIAYFPQAWHSESEFLETSFQDFPEGEPRLIHALLRPPPNRSLSFCLASKAGIKLKER